MLGLKHLIERLVLAPRFRRFRPTVIRQDRAAHCASSLQHVTDVPSTTETEKAEEEAEVRDQAMTFKVGIQQLTLEPPNIVPG